MSAFYFRLYFGFGSFQNVIALQNVALSRLVKKYKS